jgi:hypothetical protein
MNLKCTIKVCSFQLSQSSSSSSSSSNSGGGGGCGLQLWNKVRHWWNFKPRFSQTVCFFRWDSLVELVRSLLGSSTVKHNFYWMEPRLAFITLRWQKLCLTVLLPNCDHVFVNMWSVVCDHQKLDWCTEWLHLLHDHACVITDFCHAPLALQLTFTCHAHLLVSSGWFPAMG